MRGRKPKPSNLKILSGNPGKRPINDKEPKPKRARPTCPSFLSKDAKALWKKLIPELDRLGLMTVVDTSALSSFCQAWAEFKWTTETLEAEGRTLESPKRGTYPHPAVAMQRSAMQQIRAFSALFGFDPSSRSRISVPEKTRDELGELEEFLGGTG